MLAKHALSQLSYGPAEVAKSEVGHQKSDARSDFRLLISDFKTRPPPAGLVGLGGLEPPTSRLSSARSNQLSYKPGQKKKSTPARTESRRSQVFHILCPERETKAARSRKCGLTWPLDF